MTSILTSSKNDPYVFCSTLHGLSNAVYRFSMRCVVLEISGGGAEINPPPPVLGWLRPPPVRGLKHELAKGGLKVPDPSIQADSLKITWVKKFLDDENYAKWKDVAHSKVMLTENLSIFECDTSYEQALQFSKSEFWAETARAWSEVVKLDQPSSGDLLSTVLWCNQRLSPHQTAPQPHPAPPPEPAQLPMLPLKAAVLPPSADDRPQTRRLRRLRSASPCCPGACACPTFGR